jgi:hypothetical protein
MYVYIHIYIYIHITVKRFLRIQTGNNWVGIRVIHRDLCPTLMYIRMFIYVCIYINIITGCEKG